MTELIGSREHGIKRLEDFTSEKARQEARARWLTDKEYLAIVANPHRYTGLLADGLGHVHARSVLNGQQDHVLFLCNMYLGDALDLPVTESQQVYVNGNRFMTLTRSFDHALERREYVLNAAGDLKLVHYGKNTSRERVDRAAAAMLARRLAADMLAYRDSSAGRKEEILQRIKGQSSGGGGGASAAP